MSLINQMLQELDARGAPASLGGVLQGQVRAVQQQRGIHPAWWVALILSGVVLGGGLWVWSSRPASVSPQVMDTAAVLNLTQALPLKIAFTLSQQPTLLSGEAAAENLERSEKTLMPAPTPAAVTAASENTQIATKFIDKAAPVVAVVPTSTSAPSLSAADVTPTSVLPSIAVAAPNSELLIAKQVRELTPSQQAENAYRKATNLIQQARTADALAALEQAVRLDPRHAGARQTQVAVLLELGRQDEALRILQTGLQLDPAQIGLATILARLQLERNELKVALATLQRSLPYAVERADYLAFFAALLQRDNRHKEAIDQYALALRKSPENGLWWMGQAISLQATGRNQEAIAAYNRAKDANGLSAELRAFVDEKLNNL